MTLTNLEQQSILLRDAKVRFKQPCERGALQEEAGGRQTSTMMSLALPSVNQRGGTGMPWVGQRRGTL